METIRISDTGTIALPASLLQQPAFAPGQRLALEATETGLLLRPAPEEPPLEDHYCQCCCS
jgi:hypothetical protein